MRILVINKFDIYWQKRETSADYILRIKPNVDKDDEVNKYFTVNGLNIIYPTTFGVIDKSINDTLYKVVLLVNEYNDNIIDPNFPFIIQLQRKTTPILEIEEPMAKNDAMEGLDKSITEEYRGFSSIDGKSSIAMNGSTMVQDVGGTRMVLSTSDGITRNSPMTNLGIDIDSDGGMFTRTGVMNYIPSVLPFKAPTHMPDTAFLKKTGMIIQAVNKLSEVLDKLNEVTSSL